MLKHDRIKRENETRIFLESLPKLWIGYTNKVQSMIHFKISFMFTQYNQGQNKQKHKTKQPFNSCKWQATQTSQKITSIELTAWGSTVQGRSDTPPRHFAINFQSPGSISASWSKEKTTFFFTKLLFFTTSGADSLAKVLCTHILRAM